MRSGGRAGQAESKKKRGGGLINHQKLRYEGKKLLKADVRVKKQYENP